MLLASFTLVALAAAVKEARHADAEVFVAMPATKPFVSNPTSKPIVRPRRPPISGEHPNMKPFVSKPATNPFNSKPMNTTGNETMPPPPPPKWFNVSVGFGPDSMAFAPMNVYIGVGDYVRWIWTSDGHNVMSGMCGQPNGMFCSSNTTCSETFNAGFMFSRRFMEPGQYPYYCGPHCGSGMTGTVFVGPMVHNISVGDGGNTFNPATKWIRVGDKVVWQFKSGGHNVVSGGECGRPDTKFCSNNVACNMTADAGFAYERIFNTPGLYPYYCGPHCTLGMNGTIIVGPRWFNVTVGAGGAMTFEPPMLTIKVGDWVNWNFQSQSHSVVSGASCNNPDNKFCSAPGGCTSINDPDTVYSRQFNFPGVYPYYCMEHCVAGNMTGSITVMA